MSKVLVIVNGYTRPHNVGRIGEAWSKQTRKPDTLVLVDNRPKDHPQTRTFVDRSHYDDIWRFYTNLGCTCTLAPAVMLTGYRYVVFCDDDVLPGEAALENLLEQADGLGGRFACLGQVGRRFSRRSELAGLPGPSVVYETRNVPRSAVPERVDLVCRIAMMRQDFCLGALTFRNFLQEEVPEHRELFSVHDDFIRNIGIQSMTRLPSYVIPEVINTERNLIKIDLDDGAGSLWKRHNHARERQLMCDIISRIPQWKSLV